MIKKSLRAYISACQFVLLVLPHSKVLGAPALQPVKHIVHRIFEGFIILPDFHAVYHFHQRIHVAFFLRPLKHDVGHKGAVQKGFRFGPELVALLTVAFGVGDQGGDEFQHIAFRFDVGQRIVVHGFGEVDTIGSIAAEMATELEEPWKPFVAMIIYGGATLLLSIISIKFPRTRKYLNGTPTILMDNGKLYRENLKKAKLDLSEFMVMCRQQGYFDLTNIQTAIFEYNGKLTILPQSAQRPLTPNDMNLAPAQDMIFTEIIMDGRILDDNLKRMGLNTKWLENQLKQNHICSADDIFLALCDKNLKFVYFMKTQ